MRGTRVATGLLLVVVAGCVDSATTGNMGLPRGEGEHVSLKEVRQDIMADIESRPRLLDSAAMDVECEMLLHMCTRAVLGLTQIDFGEAKDLSAPEKMRRLDMLRSYRKELVYVRDGLVEDWAKATARAPELYCSSTKPHAIHDCLLGHFLRRRIEETDEEIKRLSEPAGSESGRSTK